MTLRKGKLFHPCKKCGKYFLPSGKSNWICDKCSRNGNSWLDFLARKKNHRKKQKTDKR